MYKTHTSYYLDETVLWRQQQTTTKDAWPLDFSHVQLGLQHGGSQLG